ncbi:hypothetical protein Q6346_00115 [Isoptericola sp. b490]|uniref:hypothetical protein n=1 Tax=Actinotalea lenta TaxID=3064654 RepID=UPI002713B851|nr:hypothetical protein [Isoptericola sp. b490]MDO8119712.1 hypothetical protein [Isoptericola sp. b490]
MDTNCDRSRRAAGGYTGGLRRTDPIIAITSSRRGAPRDVDALRAVLDEVATTGWESPSAAALLNYVRATIVRPLVVELGLRGAASSQAEASAWEEVWDMLRSDRLRQAESPWGVLWSTARRAILAEAICALYPTSPKRAWDLAARDGDARPSPVESLPDLDHTDLPYARIDGDLDRPRPGVAATAEALVAVGWDHPTAEAIITEILLEEPGTRGARWIARRDGWAACGWRAMAQRLGLPDWQARRLMVALRGTPQRPGLLPRMIREGAVSAALDPMWWEALAATRDRNLRSPRVPEAAPEDRCDDVAQPRERRVS